MKVRKYIIAGSILLMTCGAIQAQVGDPLGGKDTLTLENERIEDVIESTKPFLKPPYQELEKAKTEEVKFDSRDFYVETDFEPAPPDIREVEKDKEEKLQNNMLKLGFGRFATPFANIYINNGEDRDVDYGFEFGHISAHQDNLIPLREFRRDYGNLQASMVAKENTFKAQAKLLNSSYFNYANTDTIPSDGLKDSLQMGFTHFGIQGILASNYDRSRDYEFEAGAGIKLHNDRRDNSEFHFDLTPAGGFRVTPDVIVGAKTSFNFVRGKINRANQNRVLLSARPGVTYDNGDLMISGGVQVNYFKNSADTASVSQFGPAIEASYEFVPDAIAIVAGYTSGMVNNHYYGMIEENPYVATNVNIQPGIEKMNIYAGLEGNLNSKIDFAARAYYKRIENQLIYDNQADGRYFAAVYDSSMTVTGIHAEINYDLKDNIMGGVALNINNYTTSTVAKYFGASPVRLDFFAVYNWDKKLTAKGEVFVFGPRPMGIDSIGEIIRQNTFIDINLSADYRITKGFSVFLGVENLLSTKYQRWNNYIERPIDINGGITLAF